MISVTHPETKERIVFSEKKYKRALDKAQIRCIAAAEAARKANAEYNAVFKWMSALEQAEGISEALEAELRVASEVSSNG